MTKAELMEHGQCQQAGCTNVGKRSHIAWDGFEAARGLPAGERWYCDDCAKLVLEVLLADSELLSVENLATGEVVVPPKGTTTRQ